MSTKLRGCTICIDMRLVLLQTQQELTERLQQIKVLQQQIKALQQEVKVLQQEIEELKDTVPWRRIRTLHNQARADRQRFKEATLEAISKISDILGDFDFPQEAEAVSLQRVFAIAINDE